MRPFRSVLYMPGSNARALDKARGLAADALILDLEDACAPDMKPEGRRLIAEAVQQGGYGERFLMIRVNGLDTEWGAADVATVAACKPDAILLPKVGTPADIAALETAMTPHPNFADTRIWAMMETPEGVQNAAAISACSPRLQGLVLGTNDLIKELQAQFTPDRAAVMTSLSLCLLAARQHGKICLDGVFNDFRDDAGLEAECIQGRALGFDGKTLIHPAQLAVTNRVFAPSEADLEQARAYVAAYEAAIAEGKAVAVVQGRIVENLHVDNARRLLAQANAIAKMEASL